MFNKNYVDLYRFCKNRREKKQAELNRPANLLHYLRSDIRTLNKNKDSKIGLKQKQNNTLNSI